MTSVRALKQFNLAESRLTREDLDPGLLGNKLHTEFTVKNHLWGFLFFFGNGDPMAYAMGHMMSHAKAGLRLAAADRQLRKLPDYLRVQRSCIQGGVQTLK